MKITSAATLLFCDDTLTGARVGQPVTHMRSTNSKPQPSHDEDFTQIYVLTEEFHATLRSPFTK